MLTKHQATLSQAHLTDENRLIQELIQQTALNQSTLSDIETQAKQLISGVRKIRTHRGGLDAFMVQYDLSNEEGVTLMCLAEALLRIPDSETADKLIEDKICHANWNAHLGSNDSTFVNAATWSLMLTGKIIQQPHSNTQFAQIFKKLLRRQSAPLIRQAITQAMKILGKQFVLGEQIKTAQKRAKKREDRDYRYSYDMLGEAAYTDADAQSYYQAYENAIHALGKQNQDKNVIDSAGISIKLSALFSRYELHHVDAVHQQLYDRLKPLAILAAHYNIGLTIDAEEADRLELSLMLLDRLCFEPDIDHWQGLGLAVQAYQKRALSVIAYLEDLAIRSKRCLMVRLVKGAYWDSEIKLAQTLGLDDYPVYTRKVYTDVSYQACAQKLLANPKAFYPQFATHNAYTLATILSLAKPNQAFEFQCLHGMGDALYDQIVGKQGINIPCRIYAPVGNHKHLLAYLVRRLLENGANSSFVNRIANDNVPIEMLLKNPTQQAQALAAQPNPHIPLPSKLYGDARKNAKAFNLQNREKLCVIAQKIDVATAETWHAHPLVVAQNVTATKTPKPVYNPATQQPIGHVIEATSEQVSQAITDAQSACQDWSATDVEQRAKYLECCADLLEEQALTLMGLIIQESGKTLANAQAEIREAVDFCRYYAQEARRRLAVTTLPGPTGELNQLQLQGRGVIACISPWNFPLAIFLGEVSSALAAGNCVIAKPAAQTPLIAYAAVKLLHQAGIPTAVLQLLPGDGKHIGATLVSDPRIAGVIFTGSTETAQYINQTLAQNPGPIIPFIAETGGQNAMIVDSSALPEQVVRDVMLSAFDSAGQRCSALRVLYLQEDIADHLITMIKGAMDELIVGDPMNLATDIGPVIDAVAKNNLQLHLAAMQQQGYLSHQTQSPQLNGHFICPSLCEIPDISALNREVFGPILHIVRYSAKQLDQVIEQINQTGYGLTFGIHSRIQSTVDYVCKRIQAGNLYVNRNTVGAIVGVQPFGGQGLSGTGPKAGGPHYLQRLTVERCTSIDTTAAGGNASLMSID